MSQVSDFLFLPLWAKNVTFYLLLGPMDQLTTFPHFWHT